MMEKQIKRLAKSAVVIGLMSTSLMQKDVIFANDMILQEYENLVSQYVDQEAALGELDEKATLLKTQEQNLAQLGELIQLEGRYRQTADEEIAEKVYALRQ